MDIERTLGELLEQGRWVKKELGDLRSDVKLLNQDLWKRRGMIILSSTLISLMISVGIEFIIQKLKI